MRIPLVYPWGSIFYYWWLLFSLVSTNYILAQNIDMYLSLLDEGRISEVRENLPELASKYPNDPGVLFLQALTTIDGDASIEQFRTIIKTFPESRYADEAGMKIGEYLYARGLYSQASVQFRSIPLHYPTSGHVQRALNLMVKSYLATGEMDSVRYYLRIFKQKYPDIDFERYGIPDLEPEVSLVKVTASEAKEKIATAKKSRNLEKKTPMPVPMKPGPKPWVVQVGAFSKYDNARRVKMNLSQNGYDVVLDEVISQGRRLHVVRVVRFSNREEANRIGKELNRKFGLDFRVLNKPE